MLENLRWLGLDWDEGPDVGGPYGPYRQSECHGRYRAVIQRLDTYPCSCSRKEVREASVAPHGAEPRYAGHCRNGPKHPWRPTSQRWRTPAGTIEHYDEVLGFRVEDVHASVGDFVLRRSDGAWAYQLAVVADDEHMGITDVVRGEDLAHSTARQILLRRALHYREPRHAHVPVVLGPDGAKLSKRHGAPELQDLCDRGVDPRAVVTKLAISAGLVPGSAERLWPRELVAEFSWAAIRQGTRRHLPWAD